MALIPYVRVKNKIISVLWKSLQGAIKETHARHILSTDVCYFVYASLKLTIFCCK